MSYKLTKNVRSMNKRSITFEEKAAKQTHVPVCWAFLLELLSVNEEHDVLELMVDNKICRFNHKMRMNSVFVVSKREL